MTDTSDMSNTHKALNQCIECGADAYYRVVTNPSYGPSAEISRTGKGNLCRIHAIRRAANRMAAWEQRQADRKAAARISHEKWLAAYNEARNVSDPFEGLV